MAEISRRAGVGSATLYRNFANRRQLLEALYVDEIDAVCEAAVVVWAVENRRVTEDAGTWGQGCGVDRLDQAVQRGERP